eukprot:596234-Prymnesium_polylepis.1
MLMQANRANDSYTPGGGGYAGGRGRGAGGRGVWALVRLVGRGNGTVRVRVWVRCRFPIERVCHR